MGAGLAVWVKARWVGVVLLLKAMLMPDVVL